jgi:hypothetical protein
MRLFNKFGLRDRLHYQSKNARTFKPQYHEK